MLSYLDRSFANNNRGFATKKIPSNTSVSDHIIISEKMTAIMRKLFL